MTGSPPAHDVPAGRQIVAELGTILEELGALAVQLVELRTTIREMRDRSLRLADTLDDAELRAERDAIAREAYP